MKDTRGRKKDVYAVYDNDTFIDVGTYEELAKRLNVKKSTLIFYGTPAGRERGRGYIVVKVGKESDFID